MRMTRTRMVILLTMLIVLAATLAGTLLTRGVMADLPFLQARKGDWTGAYVAPGIVDQRPWQTAVTLAALAQSAEEKDLAREAERLADHEVDQAFSQSLRQASLDKPKLSGKALALQQRVTELQETVKNDEARVASLCRQQARHQRAKSPMPAIWRSPKHNLVSIKTNWPIRSKTCPAKADLSWSSFNRSWRHARPR